MNGKIALALFAGLLMIASPILAQRGTTGAATTQSRMSTAPRLDIIPMGGYVWTLSRNASYNLNSGDVDLKSGGYFGVAVDIYAVPYMQVRLLYRRQDTQLTFKRGGGISETLGDLAVEYWHIGAVKGIQQGNILPFSTFSLGGTRFAYDGGDNWKFSILLGLGAKVHLNDRIGIMVSGQMPLSFTDAFVGVGTGGVSLGGTGITQFDVTGGLVITL
jgi:opacity protein-like surface antigen